MAQFGFHFDMTSCVACKTCQIACNDKNDLKVGEIYRKVRRSEGGKYPNPWIYYLSMSCNHCEDPKCVTNCPTGASYKSAEDGRVAIDQSKCIGCQYCVWSCPYEARVYHKDSGTVGKCDMCADLIQKGEKPACVDACFMRALHFGEIEELKKQYGGVQDLEILPSSDITKPAVLITAKPIAKRRV